MSTQTTRVRPAGRDLTTAARSDAVATAPERRGDGRWTFLGASALPTDPAARSLERRGRRWLIVSYLFCPCHIPITLGLVGAAFGGTTLGAALAGSAIPVGIGLTTIYAILLWRGFRQIRRAKRLEAHGHAITCTPDGCEITPAGRDRSRVRRSMHST